MLERILAGLATYFIIAAVLAMTPLGNWPSIDLFLHCLISFYCAIHSDKLLNIWKKVL